jgi:peptidoglycan/xylan/chitin deacetylase (PgdA/CDA1 family)
MLSFMENPIIWLRQLVLGLCCSALFLDLGFAQYDMPANLNPFEVAMSEPAKTISSFPKNLPVPALALTFDDGPHPKHTPRLLDILRQYGVKATFFVVGKNVERYPDIAQRIVAEGHQIANHTMAHPNLVKLKRKRFDKEIKDTNTIIEAYTGKKPTAIRPPYGSLNVKVEATLRNLYGLNIILWSVDPEDWKKPGASEVARRLIEGAKPGAILLAHDIHEQTIDAMPEVLSQLLARGYKFGTIDQLITLSRASVPNSLGSAPGVVRPPAVAPVGQQVPASVVSGYKVPVLRALPADR